MLKKTKTNKFTAATIVYFVLIVGFILIRLASVYKVFAFMGDYATYVLNLVLQVGLMFLIPLFFYSFLIKTKPKTTLKNFGFKKIRLNAVAISVILGVIVYILNIGVSTFFAYFLALLGYERGGAGSGVETYTIITLIVNLIFTAVLPAICEEVTHRGMLIDGFSKLGYKKAILFSAILFGLTHLNIDQFFYATIIGILLGFVTMSTGNIWPAVIIHFMNNAINVLVNYALNTSIAFKNAYQNFWESLFTGSFFVSMFGMFVVISLLLLIMALLVFKLFKETAVAELNTLAEQEAKKQMRAELMGETTPSTIAVSKTDIPFRITRHGKSFQVYVSSSTLRHPIKQVFFPSLKQKAFFIASLVTASFLTIATFIWGIL